VRFATTGRGLTPNLQLVKILKYTSLIFMVFLPWCRAALITRTDGVTVSVTDFDDQFTYNGNDYSPINSIAATAVNQSQELTPSNIEVVTIISDIFTEQDLLLDRYYNATIEIFIYDWMAGTKVKTLFLGYLGEVGIDYDRNGAHKFTIKAQSLAMRLEQKNTLVTTRNCRHVFAENKPGSCRLNISSSQASYTVASVPDSASIQVNSIGQIDSYYRLGKLTFTSGVLNGISNSISSHDNQTFTLSLPYLYLPSVGDTFVVNIGCNKTLARCVELGNVLNYGGFPYLPGWNLVIQGSTTQL